MWWAWVATVGAGVVSACRQDRKKQPEPTQAPTQAATPVTDFASAMAVLLRSIGPWTPADEEIASSFIQRYQVHRAERFKASEPALIRLAQLIPPGGRVETFTLAGMPEDERKILDELIDDVFARAEVRWYLSGVPQLPAVCLGPETSPGRGSPGDRSNLTSRSVAGARIFRSNQSRWPCSGELRRCADIQHEWNECLNSPLCAGTVLTRRRDRVSAEPCVGFWRRTTVRDLHMRHSSHPAVSIIIPWLDVAIADVLRAVRSVLRQDFGGFIEVIICNDGSAPQHVSELMAALAAQRWGKVEYRVCHHERSRGPAAARNTATRAARGDWLLWLDADDELVPAAVSDLVQRGACTGVGLAMSQCWVIEPGKRIRRRPDVYVARGRRYCGTVYDPLAQAVFSLHPHMMRRDRFEELGGFDERYRWAEVTDMFLRFIDRNSLDDMVVLDEPLYNYWRRPSSLSTNRENMTAARRTVLLSYARSQSLPIEDLVYLGSCADVGAQHFLPIVAGQAIYPPYMKTRDNRVHIEGAVASPGRAGTNRWATTEPPLWESAP